MKNFFLITGNKRTGTSYLSSLMNSQENTFCFEYGMSKIKEIKDVQDLNFFNSEFNALTLHYPSIKLKNIDRFPLTKEEVIFELSKNITNHYKVENFGFKETLLSKKQIKYFIDLNYKIIITRRKFDDQYLSYLNRIEKSESESIYLIKKYVDSIENYDFKESDLRQIQFIEYENLSKNLDDTIEKLKKFLNTKLVIPNKFYYNFSKNIDFTNQFKNSAYSKKISFKDLNINDRKLKNYKKFVSNKSFFSIMNLKYLYYKKLSKKKIFILLFTISLILNIWLLLFK